MSATGRVTDFYTALGYAVDNLGKQPFVAEILRDDLRSLLPTARKLVALVEVAEKVNATKLFTRQQQDALAEPCDTVKALTREEE